MADIDINVKTSFKDFIKGQQTGDKQAKDNQKAINEILQKWKQWDTLDHKIPKRFLVNMADLKEQDKELYEKVIDDPDGSLALLEEAMNEHVRDLDDAYRKDFGEEDKIPIGFCGDFGYLKLSPRELGSQHLSKMVNVIGVVTKCSLVCPKIQKGVYYCEETQKFLTRDYRDVTSHLGHPTSSAQPAKDENGNLLTHEFGLSKYVNTQEVTIQELPESAPVGQLPASVTVILEHDLVDRVKPGDRVSVIGMYRTSGSKMSGTFSGVFPALIVANFIEANVKAIKNKQFTAKEISFFKEISRRPDTLDVLAKSLAPSIHGHQWVKRGLILLLAGGEEKNLENGTHLRGDINCLMVGDPGVAKSQLLRAVMNAAPLAVSTTGRGSSGVGLTAAVTVDNNTGDKKLEAGAMVLGDRGVVCIDEFDKMNEQDRSAIHEVMEQQTVTIAKSSIQCRLNARCSVAAAANPLYGTYDATMSITRNVNLPDSLLSRFDLLFIMRDPAIPQVDYEIGRHVVRMHSMKQRVKEQDADMPAFARVDEATQGVAYDSLVQEKQRLKQSKLVSVALLKRYIVYVKQMSVEEVPPEVSETIAQYYVELRQSSRDRALPITARTLESLIRLASAHCRIKGKRIVDIEDVAIAKSLMEVVMGSDTGPDADSDRHGRRGAGKRPKDDLGDDDMQIDQQANAHTEQQMEDVEQNHQQKHQKGGDEGGQAPDFQTLKRGIENVVRASPPGVSEFSAAHLQTQLNEQGLRVTIDEVRDCMQQMGHLADQDQTQLQVLVDNDVMYVV